MIGDHGVRPDAARRQLTLVMVHRAPHILLGMKKRGFGAGRWNGFGGKLEQGEALEDAARRELREEAGVEVATLEPAGVLTFAFTADPTLLEVHVFRATDVVGEPRETDEMRPQWFRTDEIPFDDMWPDDRLWVPLMLKGKRFRGSFLFGEGDAIIESSLTEVVEL